MNPYTNYLDRLGSNFLVAAMIPSLGMVIACLVVFDPILHASEALKIENGIPALIGISLLLAVPTILIGFTLTAMNTFLLKSFEGYVFLHRLSPMKKFQARKAEKLLVDREKVRHQIQLLEGKPDRTETDNDELEHLKADYWSITSEYDVNFPPLHELMPTKFGNILKASEAYSGDRYGIDAVTFWPHLTHVVPPSYRQGIDSARNELSFLVNMSALSMIFYFFCILAILSTTPALGTVPNWPVVFDDVFRYLFSGGVAIVLIFFFNRAAIFSVSDYGMMIRSAFDLFRLDLLEQFHLEQPNDSDREYELWRNLSELIGLGNASLDFTPLKYHFKNKP